MDAEITITVRGDDYKLVGQSKVEIKAPFITGEVIHQFTALTANDVIRQMDDAGKLEGGE